MPHLQLSTALLTLGILLLFARPAHAFGAGNIGSISAVEGINWRHGDIEDTLLTLFMARAAGGQKFDKLSVARVYFGNWLRDYSQAIDVGTVKYVSAEAIRILLWVLAFMTFGYGSLEFEVTTERLGCYRPEDHIDNPKDYADNLDARQYDRRLRGPVNERVELAIDPRTGLKNYIANEEAGITTSAGHVRGLFNRSIQLGRSYARSRNTAELYEALRLLGTGLHCLEDWSAHSNYIELALIEMGERDIFPHVGRGTQIRLQGAQSAVYPIVTGTFGGVDFLHSVMGEFDDKATQNEIQQLEGAMANGSSQNNASIIKELLNKIPPGLFGGEDQAGKADQLQANATAAQMQLNVSPRRPEEFTLFMQQVVQNIYPIVEFHDQIMKAIAEAIDKIPVLPELIEQLEDQINIFVFSLIAPFILPLIDQLKTELNQGSSEIIQSSKDKQLIVFHDDHCSDPTHSMLSKDHFSNILNEPAGKIASQVLRWVVPQLIQCWDDERVDANRTVSRIINGVFHHPALRNYGDDGAVDGRRLMFGVVEEWWRRKDRREQDDFRRKLSRQGIEQLENHKEGVHDTGHGCGKPLGMSKATAGQGASGGILGDLVSALGGGAMAAGAGSGYGRPTQGMPSEIGQFAEQAVGGGALGGLVGALAGGVGGGLLGEIFGGSNTQSYSQQHQAPGGGVTQSYTQFGQSGNQYGQAQYQQTQFPGGAQRTEFQRFEQQGSGQPAYGFEERTEIRPTYGGGYDETTERKYQHGGQVRTEYEENQYKPQDSDLDDGNKNHGKHKKKHSGGRHEWSEENEQRRHDSSGFGGGSGRQEYGGRPEPTYGREEQSSFGTANQQPPREDYGSGRRQEYGGGFEEQRREEYGGGRQQGYGGFQEPPREEFGGRPQGYGGSQEPPREEYGGRGEFGSRREDFEPHRDGRLDVPGGFGNEERNEYGARRDEEFREERREERREDSGGWFS